MRSSGFILATLLLVAGISGCTGKDGTFDPRKPYSLDLTPPEGPFEYEQGWTDGCESGMNAYSNDFYKSLNTFELRQDPNLRTNKMYYQAWKDAFLYCGLFLNVVNSTKL
jgi:hypothetical protein